MQRTAALERRALLLSASVALSMAILGIVLGLASGSQIILFDGFYAFIGLGLSWLGLRAGKLIEAGPTESHPFGRETLGPLVVGIQGTVLLGSLGFAGLESVQTILAGGGEPSAFLAVAYALVTLIGSLILVIVLRRMQVDSEIVDAELEQWWAAVVLGIVMFVGFVGVILLNDSSWSHAAGYVDPALVLVAVAILAPTPLRMIRSTMRELLEAAPHGDVALPVEIAVTEIRRRYGLPEPTMRLGKLGRKLYVELDFLVEDTGWTVTDVDRIRRDLTTLLDRPAQVLWLNVELHTDPHWDM